MKSDKLYLFKTKRFLPNFIVQFCGCLNDNILKNALIILITYGLSKHFKESTQLLVLIANTIFVLPFVIFASIAGQIADKYERSTLVKIIKFCEIAIVSLGIYGFINDNLLVLFASICLMGIHSTFFGPIKYSVLPDHLQQNELLAANGFVEAGTFISIFIGTIIGSYYTISSNFIIGALIITSITGFIASFFTPKSNNSNLEIKVNFNLFRETLAMIKYAKAKKQVYLAILGISWFWFIGAAIIAQIPSLAKDTFGADANVANLFLATFSLGVGVGSYLCSKIFENEVTSKYVFISAIGISVFGVDLFFASRISSIHYELEQLKSIFVFLSKKHNWRILIDLFCISSIGGVYIVPLFTTLQCFTNPAHRSRIIAVNNLINSIFMAASTVILSFLFYLKFSIPSVILFVSLLNVAVALYIYRLTPEVGIIPFPVIKWFFRLIFDFMYRVEVKGIENFYKAGKRSVIIANHISYIDPPLIAAYLPEEMTFAINTEISKALWVRPFLRLAKTFPIDPTNAMGIKTLINEVLKNKKIAIFPEGRISITGSLMKVYEGPGMIADKSNATILPIRIDGTQFTHFSKLKNIIKRRIFPKIIITILPPIKFQPQEDMDHKERRRYIGQALYDIMTDMIFESSNHKNTLFKSLIESARLHGFNKKIIEDFENNSITYRQLLRQSFAFTSLINKDPAYIGLMLPNMTRTLVIFYAIQAVGRRPVMINWNNDAQNIISACKTTTVKTIYSSRIFIEKAKLQGVINKITEADIKVMYLEDLSNNISFFTRIKAFIGSFCPISYYRQICSNRDSENPAAILFTSGTNAKAVVLSHGNLQANRFQITAKVQFNSCDLAFIALPIFHSFGLTSSITMLLTGVKVFFYPDPLHYRLIPEVIYDIGATVIIASDGLLNAYANYAHPYDFYSVRYIFAAIEKLQDETRQLWLDKYGIRIFATYGTTEATSVITINTPMHDKPGSVGRFLPKIEYIIKPIKEKQEYGKLFVKGVSIMLGYMHSNKPGIIEPTNSDEYGTGWHDTGDIVKLDENGHLKIVDS